MLVFNIEIKFNDGQRKVNVAVSCCCLSFCLFFNLFYYDFITILLRLFIVLAIAAWHADPEKRPTMAQLEEAFNQMIKRIDTNGNYK